MVNNINILLLLLFTECFVYMISFNPYNNPKQGLIVPIYRWGKWGSEKWSDLLKVMQPVSKKSLDSYIILQNHILYNTTIPLYQLFLTGGDFVPLTGDIWQRLQAFFIVTTWGVAIPPIMHKVTQKIYLTQNINSANVEKHLPRRLDFRCSCETDYSRQEETNAWASF